MHRYLLHPFVPKLGECLISWTLHLFAVEVFNEGTKQSGFLSPESSHRMTFSKVQLLTSALYVLKSQRNKQKFQFLKLLTYKTFSLATKYSY